MLGRVRAWLAGSGRRRFAAVLAALATLGGVIGLADWGYSRLVEKPREAREQAALTRKIDDLARALAARSADPVPGQEKEIADAIGAARAGAAAGDRRFAEALDLLKAGRTEAAAALFRQVAEEKTKRIEKDRREAAAAWRHAGAIAGLADPKTAREAYRQAVALDPENADALVWCGFLEQQAGDLAAAEAAFTHVLALAGRGAGDHDLIRARLGLGDVLVARGALAPALTRYREAHDIAARLAAADPGNASWQRDLSVSHERIGDVRRDQGSLADALASFRATLAIFERLAAVDPGNASWQSDLAVSHNKIGDVQRDQGSLADALASYQASLAISERLAAADPGNAGWQRDLSVSHDRIGDVQREQGELADALASYQASFAIRKRLAVADPGNALWQRDLSVAHNKIGDVQRDQGSLADALASYQAGLAIFERLAAADPGNASWQRDLALSLQRIGLVAADEGDANAARQAWRRGLAIMERLTQLAPDHVHFVSQRRWFEERLAGLDRGPPSP